jgi:hypothetical protein
MAPMAPTRSCPFARTCPNVPINIIHNGSDFSGVVFGNGELKLILGRAATPPAEAIRGWARGGLYPPVELPPAGEPSPLLFNLSADPTERHPLPPGAFPHLVRVEIYSE